MMMFNVFFLRPSKNEFIIQTHFILKREMEILFLLTLHNEAVNTYQQLILL